MLEYLKTYKVKPWPKLEIPPMRRPQLWALIIYTAALIGGGWWIWFSGDIHAEYFIILGLAIPVLFFLKSPYVTIIGLLALQVVIAFIFIGNQDYALMIVAGFIGAIIAFESPIIMYMFLVVAMWIDISPIGFGYPLRMEVIIGSGLLAGWLFKDVLQPRVAKAQIDFPEMKLALIYLLWISLAFALWSYDISLAWQQYKHVIAAVLFFGISPLVINNEKRLDWALLAWMAIGLIASGAAFFGPALGFQAKEATTWGTQYGALGSHKNWISALMALSFFITLSYFYWCRSLWKKIAIILGLPFIFAAIVYQQSKATAASLAFSVVLFWILDSLFSRQKKSTIQRIGLIFLVVSTILITILAIYFIGMVDLLGAYYDLFYKPTSGDTMQARYELWGISYDMIKGEGHPLRGLGPGAFWYLGTPYGVSTIIGMEASEFPDIHPHCLYLDIFLHLGVIGLVTFCWIAISLLRKLWRSFRSFRSAKYRYLCLGLFCSLISFYIHGFVEFQYHNIISFWAYLGLAVAVLNIARRLESADIPNNDFGQ